MKTLGARSYRYWATVMGFGAMVACGGMTTKEDVGGVKASALSPSTFESSDGDLTVGTAGNQDWVNAPNRVGKDDIADPKTDNAFGQGTKEDDPSVTVVTGSIPPQKSNLTRFYIGHENLNGDFLLYLAWERSNNLGSANMDFEFNQATQTLTDSTIGPVALKRTAGDMLITYDFGGSGAPTLSLLRWVTTGSVTQCYSASSLPCWGNRTEIGSAYSDGAVNDGLSGHAGSVTDSIRNPAVALGLNQFGEAAINLSKAGPGGTSIFPQGQCVNFASVFLKSRSSASFTAEVKDFIAPANANITNCGTIAVHKTDGTKALAGAGFTLYSGATPNGTSCTGGTVVSTCTSDASGNCTFQKNGANIPFGTYCVAETTTPQYYYTADAQSVTISANSDSATVSFVDIIMPGALKITKTGTNGSPLAGAVFEVKTGNNVVGSYTSGADGTVCVTNLTIGASYTVTETTAPANYSIDTTSKSVTITGPATSCATGGGAAQLGFTDSPYSAISCNFTSSAGANVTSASIQCTGDNGSSSFVTKSMQNLVPGTYTCTFVIKSP
jgi:hypothetical protein